MPEVESITLNNDLDKKTLNKKQKVWLNYFIPCHDCGSFIQPYRTRKRAVSVHLQIYMTKQQYGVPLCKMCGNKRYFGGSNR